MFTTVFFSNIFLFSDCLCSRGHSTDKENKGTPPSTVFFQPAKRDKSKATRFDGYFTPVFHATTPVSSYHEQSDQTCSRALFTRSRKQTTVFTVFFTSLNEQNPKPPALTDPSRSFFTHLRRLDSFHEQTDQDNHKRLFQNSHPQTTYCCFSRENRCPETALFPPPLMTTNSHETHRCSPVTPVVLISTLPMTTTDTNHLLVSVFCCNTVSKQPLLWQPRETAPAVPASAAMAAPHPKAPHLRKSTLKPALIERSSDTNCWIRKGIQERNYILTMGHLIFQLQTLTWKT